MNPSSEYKRRLEARTKTAEHYKKLVVWIANLRLVAGVAFVIIAWLAAGPHAVSGWWLLLPVAAFVALAVYHDRVRAQGRRTQRARPPS